MSKQSQFHSARTLIVAASYRYVVTLFLFMVGICYFVHELCSAPVLGETGAAIPIDSSDESKSPEFQASPT